MSLNIFLLTVLFVYVVSPVDLLYTQENSQFYDLLNDHVELMDDDDKA